MEVIGCIFAFIIGVVITLLGGGGSTLFIPVFVYLFHVDPYLASSYSLLIVASSSLLSSVDNWRSKRILFKPAFFFVFPIVITSLVIRQLILPRIPEIISITDSFQFERNSGLMIIYALIIIAISLVALQSRKEVASQKNNYSLVVLQAIIVGIITGFIGNGGGFLIVPAMLYVLKIPIKNAIATTLFVVSITSSVNFIGDQFTILKFEWSFVLTFLISTLLGVLVGNQFKNKISEVSLRKIFNYFILLLGVGILFFELISLF